MGQYLHLYRSLEDFQRDYDDEEGVALSFVCSAGTFVYDGYGEIGEAEGYKWKNGDKVLATPWRNPKIGLWNYGAGTGAYDLEANEGVEITAIGQREPAKYHEPWVSYTTGTMTTIRTHCYSGGGMSGELDITEVGTTDIVFNGDCV